MKDSFNPYLNQETTKKENYSELKEYYDCAYSYYRYLTQLLDYEIKQKELLKKL